LVVPRSCVLSWTWLHNMLFLPGNVDLLTTPRGLSGPRGASFVAVRFAAVNRKARTRALVGYLQNSDAVLGFARGTAWGGDDRER
jgi:hypothetical protein